VKVLFISSGNNLTGISPIVFNQGESIKARGIDLHYFTIKSKGLSGYLKAVPQIKKEIASNSYDVVHAHYSLSAYAATLAGASPLIVSLMGSDVAANKKNKFLIRFFYYNFWDQCIVKSVNMKSHLRLKGLHIIPNGVDFERFRTLSRSECIKKLNWNLDKRHLLFAANPQRPEKNFKLLQEAAGFLSSSNIEIHTLVNVPNAEMVYYYNSVDVVILTSLREGSPNVIKEAMACNCPLVATDVGDIKEIIGKTEGCFITSFKAMDLAEKIKKALAFNSRTEGRNKIEGLRAENIADKIIEIYYNEVHHKT
jgi:teichuronic acid biosynthesis glycosyltransferase TuaC